MSKSEQLIEFATSDIIAMLCDDKKIELDEAMNMFYNSQVFEKLQDEQTGLYLESSAYVYGLYKDELKFGKIVQMEIQLSLFTQELS